MHAAVEALPVEDLHGLVRLIDVIYAAASAETSWERALEALGQHGAFDACLLTSVDPLDRRPFVLGMNARPSVDAPGILPPNPLLTDSVLRSAPGALWLAHEIMPPALLRATTFWTEWMLPQSFTAWAGMLIGRRGAQVVCLELYARGRPNAVGPGARHLLSRLAPHLTRAWRLGEDIRPLPRPTYDPAAADEPVDGGARRASSPDANLTRMVRLRAEFGLTKAEARLAIALSDGCSPAQAAKDFDVKLTTVRSQLQQIFAKTGTSRQAELVAMLLDRMYRGSMNQRRPRQPAAC